MNPENYNIKNFKSWRSRASPKTFIKYVTFLYHFKKEHWCDLLFVQLDCLDKKSHIDTEEVKCLCADYLCFIISYLSSV